jgi:hypothetical protein
VGKARYKTAIKYAGKEKVEIEEEVAAGEISKSSLQ